MDVVPKQRYNRVPSAGDHIHATTNFEYAWTTTGHTIIRVSQKSKKYLQLHVRKSSVRK